MPFTGSHPAAVLPLMRWGLVPSALVIGSMSPDLPYYLPLRGSFDVTISRLTHTAGGVLGIDLGLGLLAFAAWQLLVAPLAVAAVPEALRARLPPELPVPWRRHLGGSAVLRVLLSLWIGAATHVLWDEFTHPDRWGYRHINWLATRHGPLDGYRWAQYASGVIGGLLIIEAIWRWWRSAVPSTAPGPGLSRPAAIATWTVIGLAAGLGCLAAVVHSVLADQGVRRALFLIATWGGGAGAAAVLLVAVIRQSSAVLRVGSSG